MAVTLPPAPSKVVFTGPIGPGNSLTTYSFNNVRQVNLFFDRAVAEIAFYGQPGYSHLAIDGISTFTATIAADVATITLS